MHKHGYGHHHGECGCHHGHDRHGGNAYHDDECSDHMGHHHHCRCHSGEGYGHHGHHHMGCGCKQHGGAYHGGFRRHFLSPTEKREMLVEYIEHLKKELEGAEAALKKLDSNDDA